MRLGRATVRRRNADGAVAVEFALILPVLAMLMMGIITGGLSYSNALGVQNAVREGSRFGATAVVTSSTWNADVVSRVRSTQFDDSATAGTSQTSVCVQLVKASATGAISEVADKSGCSAGGNGGPTLAMPAFTDYPAVPTLPANSCAVRVIAARNFSINIVLTSFSDVVKRGAVARYEGTC